MTNASQEEIQTALLTIREAKEQAIKALKLSDPEDKKSPYPTSPEQPPAAEAVIAALEAAIGKKLAPSYRHLLTVQNGIPDIDLGTDILSADAVASYHTRQAPKRLPRILTEIDRETAEGLLVFGSSSGHKPSFIFDTSRTDANGDWAVIEYDNEDGLLDEYDNLLAFLEDLAETVRLTGEL